jgi:hypothetical protein
MVTPSGELQDLVNRIRMEYLEMPGLALTSGQARRMWNLDPALCDAVLSTLVREEFLSETRNGAFLRRGDGGRRPTAAASSRAGQPDLTVM